MANAVRELRADYPMWGKIEPAVLLRREGYAVSESAVGRILKGAPARVERPRRRHRRRHPAKPGSGSKTEDLLKSVPGVGDAAARTLIADLPKLGRLDRRKIAAPVGVASLDRNRGAVRGRRTVWGGRANVRAALTVAALVASGRNPILKRFYRRLVEPGKPKKLALVAVMRKPLAILNAIVRGRKPGQSA